MDDLPTSDTDLDILLCWEDICASICSIFLMVTGIGTVSHVGVGCWDQPRFPMAEMDHERSKSRAGPEHGLESS